MEEGKKNNFDTIRHWYKICFNHISDLHKENYLIEHLKNIALIMTGHILSNIWVFTKYGAENEEQITMATEEAYKSIAEPIVKKLPNRNDLSDANRSWRFVVQWVNANRQHFWGGTEKDEKGNPKSPANEIYGEIVEGEYVAIFPSFLKAALNKEGYPAEKVLKDFRFRRWIESDKNGYDPNKRIKGIQSRVVMIPYINLTGAITESAL